MAQPPSVRSISKEILSGEPREALARLGGVVSQFMGQVADALARNLTVSQNLAQAWLYVDVTEGTLPPVQAVPGLKNRVPFGVTVEQVHVLNGGAAPTSTVSVHWEGATISRTDGGREQGISILAVYGLASGTQARLKLLVKAE